MHQPTREVKDEAEKRKIIRLNTKKIKAALDYIDEALSDADYTAVSIEARFICKHADRISRACYGRTNTTQKKKMKKSLTVYTQYGINAMR